MSAQPHLALASSPFHAHLPNSQYSNIRSRCTPPRPTLPIPTLQKYPATATAATGGTEQPGLATDLFHVLGFHHVEFWCADAASAAARFSFGLGVPLAATSDLSTGNTAHASRLLRSRSGSLALLFTAPCARRGADFGLSRLDHVDGNVPDLAPVAAHVAGFHKFWQFDADQVGTAESGMNGVVLANGSRTVLLTLVEPVHGTKRRSQVQTYLDHHGGPGVQHLAMASDDILRTLREIRARSSMGGFELLPPPPASYYDGVRRRAGDMLSEAQIRECQELGVRVDRGDDDGVVLQVFTKPAGDRPTLLLEFIQRIGCMEKDEGGQEYQSGGCGGFAKGNVSGLIKSIEDYEKSLDAPARLAS